MSHNSVPQPVTYSKTAGWVVLAADAAGIAVFAILAISGVRFTAGFDGAALLVLILATIYMIPSIVAWRRHVPNVASVVVINALLGWSVVGWVVALAMAVRDRRPAPAR